MAAPVVASIEEVTRGDVEQVFVPYIIPMPVLQKNTQGMWAFAGYDASYAPWPHSYNNACPWGQQGNHAKKSVARPRANGLSKPVLSQRTNGDMTSKSQALTNDSVTILLSNLPKMFCTRQCVEVAIEQAGLEKEVQCFVVLSEKAEAVLALDGEAAAQRCIRHFNGLRWAKNAGQVSARYCAQARKHLQATEELQSRSNRPSMGSKSVKTSKKWSAILKMRR